MRKGLRSKLISGQEIRVRVELGHSADCTAVRRGDVLWVLDGVVWRDTRGGNRTHNRRWLEFRCNGCSSAEYGDNKQFCVGRAIIPDAGVSAIINAVLGN